MHTLVNSLPFGKNLSTGQSYCPCDQQDRQSAIWRKGGPRSSWTDWAYISELPQHPQVVAFSSDLVHVLGLVLALSDSCAFICSIPLWLLFKDGWMRHRELDMKSWESGVGMGLLDCNGRDASPAEAVGGVGAGRSMGKESTREETENVRSGFISLLPHMDDCKYKQHTGPTAMKACRAQKYIL